MSPCLHPAVVAGLLALAAGAVAQCPPETAVPTGAGVLEGDTLVVSQGTATEVYRHVGTSWLLEYSTPEAGQISLSGTRFLLGWGAQAHVYENVAGAWQPGAWFSIGDARDLPGGDYIHGDVVYLGVIRADYYPYPDIGAFDPREWDGTSWAQRPYITRSTSHPGRATFPEYFGESLDADGDAVVAGCRAHTHTWWAGLWDEGGVHVFRRVGAGWSEEAELIPDDGAGGDFTGSSVAISGDVIIGGATLDDNAMGTDAGSAVVWTRLAGTWVQQARLIPDEAVPNSHYGATVQVDGNIAVVESHRDSAVFTYCGGTWTEVDHMPGRGSLSRPLLAINSGVTPGVLIYDLSCRIDLDCDGVVGNADPCPDSNNAPFVTIDEDTSVINVPLPGGCTLMDRIGECEARATSHGDFVSCVGRAAGEARDAGLLSGADHGRLLSSAARSSIGH